MKSLAELQKDIKQVAVDRDWEQFHTPKNLSLALGGEVGELFELLQWKKDEEILNFSEDEKRKVAHEAADILYYLLRFCDVMKIDLLYAAEEKMKLNKLKYPIEKAKGSAKKYDEL